MYSPAGSKLCRSEMSVCCCQTVIRQNDRHAERGAYATGDGAEPKNHSCSSQILLSNPLPPFVVRMLFRSAHGAVPFQYEVGRFTRWAIRSWLTALSWCKQICRRFYAVHDRKSQTRVGPSTKIVLELWRVPGLLLHDRRPTHKMKLALMLGI